MFKSTLKTIAALLLLSTLNLAHTQAQSFLGGLFSKDNVSEAVGNVLGNATTLSAKDIAGTWYYDSSACKFESEDLLSKAGGMVAASTVEKKLDEIYAKAHLSREKLNFQFNADGTFTSTIWGKKLSGTFTLDPETKAIKMDYKAAGLVRIGTIEGEAAKVGDELTLYFKADRLLKLLITTADLTQIKTLQTISSLAKNYTGLLLGFEMKK